jgi:uncharacterized membrane protein
MKSKSIIILAEAALLAALCYIGFQFLRIDIPLPGGKTALHFGNAFCVLAALLLGGLYGGLAGAVGMTIADLTSGYATSAPQTFFLKLCIGLIVGLIAHKIAKINNHSESKYYFKWALISSICGMLFNIVMDPVVSYLYKRFILGVEANAASILAKWTAFATFFNAVTTVIIAVVLYCALRPALIKSGLFPGQQK